MLKILKGVFLAAFAGCCWGSMAVAAQYLLLTAVLKPVTLQRFA